MINDDECQTMRRMSSYYAIFGGSSTNKSYNVQPSQSATNKRRKSNSTGTGQDKTRVTEEDQMSVQPLPEYCGTFEVTQITQICHRFGNIEPLDFHSFHRKLSTYMLKLVKSLFCIFCASFSSKYSLKFSGRYFWSFSLWKRKTRASNYLLL